MKKLTKIISLVLLLSLVLSVFAGFSIFAEEAVSDAAPASSRVEVWNIDSATERTISGAKEGDSFIRTTDEFGNSIWVQKHDLDAKATAFWNVMLPGASDANSVRFADVVKTTTDAESGAIKPLDEDGDGKADVKYEKNTDYFVIDFDIATDTFFMPDTLLHTRFLSDTLSNSLANVIQNAATYINVNKGATETSGLTVNGSSAKFASGNKWTNVTIVYDVTADFDHMAVEAGGAEAAPTYAGYIYIDGIYVGAASTAWMRDNSKNNKYSTSLHYAKMFESIRVEQTTVATGSSTSYANFTISKFPVGYEGMITESGVLGSSAVTLHNIPELQYTLANTPGTPESYTAPKLADITRTVDGVETVIPVYEVDDLHGDLLDGDIVTAYANLKSLREIYAVKMVSKTTVDEATGESVTADAPANITWLDASGAPLEEDKIPAILDVPSEADWIMIRSNKLLYFGDNKTAAVGTGANAVVVDPLFHHLPENSTEVVLFADYVGYGRGGASGEIDGVPTTTTSSSANAIGKGTTVFDLNGYTFTNATVYQHYFVGGATGYELILENGTINNPGGLNLFAVTASGNIGRVVIDDCTLNLTGGTIYDIRSGLALYNNSVINNAKALTNQKAVGAGKTYFVAANCDINSTAEYLVHNGQVSATAPDGTKQRQGSCNLFSAFYNSEIDLGKGQLVFNEIYANKSHTAAASVANKNRYDVNIIGGSIVTYNTLVSSSVELLPAAGDNVLDIDTNINIYDASVKTFALITGKRGTTDDTLVDLTNTVVVDGGYLGFFRIEDDGTKKPGGLSNYSAEINATFYLSEGVTLDNVNPYRPDKTGYFVPEIVVPEGAEIAYTSASDANLIVTKSYETYSYILDDAAPVEFFWNSADGEKVEIGKVYDLTPVEGAYSYEWSVSEDGKVYTITRKLEVEIGAKSNLTLYDAFTYNLYIPVSIVNGESTSVTVKDISGTVIIPIVTVEIDGVSYYKYSTEKLSATMVEADAFEITATIGKLSMTETVSIYDYLASAVNTENEADKALIDAIINYVYAAYVYADMDTANIDAIRTESTVEVDSASAKLEALPGVEIALNYGGKLTWGIKAAAGTELDFKIGDTSWHLTFGEKPIYIDAMSARDFFTDVTITLGDTSATFNLGGYVNALEGGEAKDVALAIYAYAKAAAEYEIPVTPEPAPEEPDAPSTAA